jgi:hypothetical protein
MERANEGQGPAPVGPLGDLSDPVIAYRWMSARAALGIEIRTGLSHSKGSILSMLRKVGVTRANNKKQAWLDLDKALTDAGCPAGKRPWVAHDDNRASPGPRGAELCARYYA